MKYVYTFIFAIFLFTAFGQGAGTTAPKQALNMEEVDKVPVYQGCDADASNEELMNCMTENMVKFIGQNFNYPEDAANQKKEGKIYVNFVVETDGYISEVTVARGVYPSLDKEAVRVIRLMPKFTSPAMNKGEKVRIQYTIPISAKL